MQKLTWHTEKRKVSELRLLENNPRTITKEGFEKLKKDIDELGQFRPLVCDTDLTVLGGNQRKRVADLSGDVEIEVSLPSRKLSEGEKKKVIVLDNEHRGEFDMDILANDYQDILKELDFSNLMPEPVIEVNEDDYEQPEEVVTEIKRGDVILLGKHRLMCGDSTSKEDVEKLMDGKKADMVFTDPPYGVGYDTDTRPSGKPKKSLGKVLNDDLNDLEFSRFLSSFLINQLSVTKDSAIFYICFGGKKYHLLAPLLSEMGYKISSRIIWVKNQFVLGRSDYHTQWEFIIYCWKDGNAHAFYGGRNQSDVWEEKQETHGTYLHPTMKPIKLISRAIYNSTIDNDIILDVFGGSGSTLIACEQTNRICYMMEIDQKYCEVICQRWEKLTGKTRTKVEQSVE
jgi:DNA modification methylase